MEAKKTFDLFGINEVKHLKPFYDAIKNNLTLSLQKKSKNENFSLARYVFLLTSISLLKSEDKPLNRKEVLEMALIRSISNTSIHGKREHAYVINDMKADKILGLLTNNQYFYQMWGKYKLGISKEAKFVKEVARDIRHQNISEKDIEFINAILKIGDKKADLNTVADQVCSCALLGIAIIEELNLINIDVEQFLQMLFLKNFKKGNFNVPDERTTKSINLKNDNMNKLWLEVQVGGSLELSFANNVLKLSKYFDSLEKSNILSN